jgi:hypothetical protein
MKSTWLILLVVCALVRAAEPPMPPSPVQEFRNWLRSDEERKVALATRSPESRAAIQRKIDEYMKLPPAEREMKLTATEFQWYLKPLLKMAAGPARNAEVIKVPVLWQPMIMQRLSEWDKVSPKLKQEAFEHQLVVEYVSTPAHKQQAVLRSLSEEERKALAQRLGRWQMLPATARARMDDRLREFFALDSAQRQETLNNFSPAERKRMELTLQAFSALTREQREVCIRSFAQFAGKFASMTDAEKVAFLKNVDRWQEMSQEERDTWRQVVAIVPPMPPIPLPPISGPPMPPTQRQ